MRKLVQAVALLAAVTAAFPVVAQATSVPGPNGKIAFASGRANEQFPAPAAKDDANARIWVVDGPNGTAVQVTTVPSGQHRHPNWSPDHTKIVYAAGVAFSGEYALWIKDLSTGGSFQFLEKAPKQDRPSWSPDGSQIAYGSQGDLWIKSLEPGATAVNLTNSSEYTEERPVWSPDGNTLYFNREKVPVDANKRDLYKMSANVGAAELPVLTGVTDDWQPALSPDGERLCFLRGGQDESADLWTVNANGTGANSYAARPGLGDLNCVWSPDGTRIAYTEGAFYKGQMVSRGINGGTIDSFLNNIDEHFDGNADWATNFPPTCDSRTLGTEVNKFVSVQLACTDPDFGFGKEAAGPEPIEETGIEIVSPPAHGTIGGISDDAKVVYTPNKDFKGTDTFTYTGEDNASKAQSATVTINVTGGGGGGDKAAPRISGVKVSPKVWSLGSKLAKISLAPTGTTISFRINEAARTTLTFQRKLRRGGKTTFKTAGKIIRQAKAGKRKVKFQGRLSKRKSLKPGTYRVLVGAVDGSGNRSKAVKGPAFTIVTD